MTVETTRRGSTVTLSLANCHKSMLLGSYLSIGTATQREDNSCGWFHFGCSTSATSPGVVTLRTCASWNPWRRILIGADFPTMGPSCTVPITTGPGDQERPKPETSHPQATSVEDEAPPPGDDSLCGSAIRCAKLVPWCYSLLPFNQRSTVHWATSSTIMLKVIS